MQSARVKALTNANYCGSEFVSKIGQSNAGSMQLSRYGFVA